MQGLSWRYKKLNKTKYQESLVETVVKLVNIFTMQYFTNEKREFTEQDR